MAERLTSPRGSGGPGSGDDRARRDAGPIDELEGLARTLAAGLAERPDVVTRSRHLAAIRRARHGRQEPREDRPG